VMIQKRCRRIWKQWCDILLYSASRKFVSKILPWLSTCDKCHYQSCKSYLAQCPQPQAVPKLAQWIRSWMWGNLVYYSEVRWLSYSNMLKCMFSLRKEVQDFMERKKKSVHEFQDP
jgi:hypothetical protein